jgi:O-antigen/teichoic acid export membrane protein
MGLRASLQLVSLTPHDTSTSQGRALERRRKIVLTSVVSVGARVVSVGAGLISVPLTFRYLNLESFGMWVVISSLMGVLQFADLGLGNGVKSSIAKASAADNPAEVRTIVSNGYVLLTGVSILLMALFLLAYPMVGWAALLNVRSPDAAAEAGSAVRAFVLCLLAGIPLAAVANIQIGLQQGYQAALWKGAESLCSLAAIAAAILCQASITELVVCYFGAPLVPCALNTVIFFYRNKTIMPKASDLAPSVAAGLLSTGLLFLILQIAVAVTFSLDALLISHALGPIAVAQYAIPDKMLSVIPAVVSIALSPLWPAYSEAIARNDTDWVRSAFNASLLFAALVSLGLGAVLVVLHPAILAIWVPGYSGASYLLIMLIAAWRCVEAIGYALSMYLNGVQVFTLQASVAVITSVVAVAMKYRLLTRIGLPGVPIGMICSYAGFTLLPCGIWVLLRLRGRSALSPGLRAAP